MKKTFILSLMFSIAIIASGQNAEKKEVSTQLKKARAKWPPDSTKSKKTNFRYGSTKVFKPIYYVNNVLRDEKTINSISPNEIKKVNVIKGSFKINDKVYTAKVYIELKNDNPLKVKPVGLNSASTKTNSPNKIKPAVYVNNILFNESMLKLIKPSEIDHINVLKGDWKINGKSFNEKVIIVLKKNSTFFSKYISTDKKSKKE